MKARKFISSQANSRCLYLPSIKSGLVLLEPVPKLELSEDLTIARLQCYLRRKMNEYLKIGKIERKKYQRFIPKPHAHFHSIQETSAKFQNNWKKTVRGVAPTRYPVYFHLKSYGMTEWQNHRMTKGQGKSSIDPTFSKRGYNKLSPRTECQWELSPSQDRTCEVQPANHCGTELLR